jgi:glyoxylase-like metal-dependent hydrolase (beta-lactamase superfamily II)
VEGKQKNKTRTDFQQGSPKKMFESINKLYKSLPDECVVYPGHDYNGNLKTTIGEEKKFNTRIFEGQTIERFTEIMNNLKLKAPEKLHLAVPSNLIGGIEWTKPIKLANGIYYGAHTNKHDLDDLKESNVKLFINLMGKEEETYDDGQEEVTIKLK